MFLCFILVQKPQEMTSASSTGSCYWCPCLFSLRPGTRQPQGRLAFLCPSHLTFFTPPCFPLAGQRSIRVTALPSPGIIGQRGVLGCAFQPDIRMGSVAIRWDKAGVAGPVHEFRGGQDHLQEQAALFQGRTAVFMEQVMGGNASLELRDVRLSDAGTYQCSVTTARGSGAALLHYRTGGEGCQGFHPGAKHMLAWLGWTHLWLCWCWRLCVQHSPLQQLPWALHS